MFFFEKGRVSNDWCKEPLVALRGEEPLLGYQKIQWMQNQAKCESFYYAPVELLWPCIAQTSYTPYFFVGFLKIIRNQKSHGAKQVVGGISSKIIMRDIIIDKIIFQTPRSTGLITLITFFKGKYHFFQNCSIHASKQKHIDGNLAYISFAVIDGRHRRRRYWIDPRFRV